MTERQHLRHEHEGFAVALDVAERLERNQRAPHGGARQLDLPRDFGERHALRLRTEGANDREAARERGHEVGLFGGVARALGKERLIHGAVTDYHFRRRPREDCASNLQISLADWARSERLKSRAWK